MVALTSDEHPGRPFPDYAVRASILGPGPSKTGNTVLDVDTELLTGGCVISPRGRVTLLTAPQLRDEIVARLAAGDRLIVVDLSGTTFVDSSGLGALVSCLKSARQAGGDLRLVAPTEQVSMVLRLTNLDRILKPRASVAAALDD